MHALVSLLEDEHYQWVEKLWTELETELGVTGLYKTPYPHFSYHIAEHYDMDLLDAVLEHVASFSTPFEISTAGLGIFLNPQPVVYLNIIRSPMLNAFQHLLWRELVGVCSNPAEYYHPTYWVPHITLADSDTLPKHLPQIINLLSKKSMHRTMKVTNLALIAQTSDGQEVPFHLHFRTRPKADN